MFYHQFTDKTIQQEKFSDKTENLYEWKVGKQELSESAMQQETSEDISEQINEEQEGEKEKKSEKGSDALSDKEKEEAVDNDAETVKADRKEENQKNDIRSETSQQTNKDSGETVDSKKEQSDKTESEQEIPNKSTDTETNTEDENKDRIEQAEKNEFPAIVVSNEQAKPGQTVVVKVTLVNNPGILGTSMTLSYDESAMTLLKAENGEAFNNVLTMSRSKQLGNGCVFLWDGEDVSEDEIFDGTILTLEFQISESASAGKVPILLLNTEGGTVDANLENVELISENGVITITE